MADLPNSTPKKRSAGEWRPVFIETLRQTGNVRASCKQAGIDRKTAYNARDAAPEFAAQWAEAMEDAIDALEAVAQQRARKSSDLLLMFLLKAHRPDKYRETRDVNLNANVNLRMNADALAHLWQQAHAAAQEPTE